MTAENKPKLGEKGYDPWSDPAQWRAARVIAIVGVLIIAGIVAWGVLSTADTEPDARQEQTAEATTPHVPAPVREATTVTTTYSPGMSEADINRLTTYAVFLGRAVACRVDSTAEMEAVARWIDAKMPLGSDDRKTLFPIFMQGVQSHADAQANGRSPDSCDKVREQFALVPWP